MNNKKWILALAGMAVALSSLGAVAAPVGVFAGYRVEASYKRDGSTIVFSKGKKRNIQLFYPAGTVKADRWNEKAGEYIASRGWTQREAWLVTPAWSELALPFAGNDIEGVLFVAHFKGHAARVVVTAPNGELAAFVKESQPLLASFGAREVADKP